jgi:hypothetical protein
MRTRILRLAGAFVLCAVPAFAATVAKPGVTPVEAELMTDMHSHLLRVGASVFAKVQGDWRGSGCDLTEGAIVEGHIIAVTAHSKVVKDSEVDVAFTRAQCGEMQLGAFNLVLAAVVAGPEHTDLGIITAPIPIGTAGGAGSVYAVKGMQMSALVNRQMGPLGYRPDLSRLKMGDVSGFKGMKLSVGTGPENSSVLTLKDHDVVLEKHTLLLLVPLDGAFPHGASSGAAAGASAAPALPVAPLVEDIDTCDPPQCNVALPAGTASEAGKAEGSIAIGQLGYAPRPQKVLGAFDNDEALAYLGPRELLVAFNPHELTPRHTLGRSGPTQRVIRAALVDTKTHRVTHTVDWELPDNRQFLWPLGDGRVLVHAGAELRVYGAGLKIENRIAIDGPLAFVRVTPDGSFIAVGVVRERHTPELHAQLRESLGAEPEEDVDIRVLNRKFESIASSTSRSNLMAPALLNEGQAALLAQPDMRYRISMLPWDKQAFTLARFESSCMPELSSFAPDLILLVSCDKDNQAFEYRVLRADGRLALKTIPNVTMFGYAAAGSADRQAFVVKTVQATHAVQDGSLFSAADFSQEELNVYRSGDGRRTLRVLVSSPSTSRDGFALAPDGSELAVLTRDQIAVYSVPGK